MLPEQLTDTLLDALQRPDLATMAQGRTIRLRPGLPTSFLVTRDVSILIGDAAERSLDSCFRAFTLRHALELSALLETFHQAPPPSAQSRTRLVRASLAAARTAAPFRCLDVNIQGAKRPWPTWIDELGDDAPPEPSALGPLWRALRPFLDEGFDAPDSLNTAESADLHDWCVANWDLIGPSEALMAAGGDARLKNDPHTGLNHYGCSHRPRPWVATFASSTASSVSERGFMGAEHARLRLQLALLDGNQAAVLNTLAAEIRSYLADHYGLASGDQVILAPSGTDCELAALALATMTPGGSTDAVPVANILIAPQETGSGVPNAAAGRHFANDTALGHVVEKGTLVPGYPGTSTAPIAAETQVVDIPLRDAAGRPLAPDQIASFCRETVATAIGAGRRVLLHQLDLSKTGLVAPDEATLDALTARFGDGLDIVVDACQVRLMPERIRRWVAKERAVMITGSKFVTGPPFCGALLLPESWVRRLEHATLPEGLAAYAARAEWPDRTATRCLSERPNHGLILRWHAAMAEMDAFAAVPPIEIRRRLSCFLDALRSTIEASPDLLPVAIPKPDRPSLPDQWDDIATIQCFLIRAPHTDSECFKPLDVENARKLYQWLNADLTQLFPHASEATGRIAGRQCHIGQPVPLPDATLGGKPAGALRMSAGARLVSGEPSHQGLGTEARLAREIADARVVIAKIALILEHWDRIADANPVPTYTRLRRRAAP